METLKALILTVILRSLVWQALSFLLYYHIYRTLYNVSNLQLLS